MKMSFTSPIANALRQTGADATRALLQDVAALARLAPQVLDKLEEVLEVPAGRTTKDGLFTLNATRCLGACGLAPVMMVNDDVYGRLTPDQVPDIIAKYRQ